MTALDRLARALMAAEATIMRDKDRVTQSADPKALVRAVLTAMRDELSEEAVDAGESEQNEPDIEEVERVVKAYINHILEEGRQ